jgi:thiopeptide-type bacteriocin biosynthesis protein
LNQSNGKQPGGNSGKRVGKGYEFILRTSNGNNRIHVLHFFQHRSMTDWEVLSGLFLRTPARSFVHYTADLDDEMMPAVLADPAFRLALHLASPEFFRLLEAKGFAGLSSKELVTVKKYLNRMSFRPTPFGAFSAFTLTEWSDSGPVRVADRRGIRVHLLADQRVATLASERIKEASLSPDYGLNPTLYPVGAEYRFIKTSREEGASKLHFTLESFDANPLSTPLFRYLAMSPRSAAEIAGFIRLKTGCHPADAAEYASFLIGAQIIVSQWDLSITGPDYLLGGHRRELPGALNRLAQEFEKIRTISAETPVAVLRQTEQQIDALLTKQREGELPAKFYANAERPLLCGGLAPQYRDELLQAVAALIKISAVPQQPLLARFVQAFSARFDKQKIPLLQAMDPDAGVGYGDLAEQAEDSKLLNGVKIPEKAAAAQQIEWTNLNRLFLRKWNALEGGAGLILDEADLAGISPPGEYPLPPSLAVMFRITEAGLLVETAGGVTGAALIGRFTPLSPEVHQLARAIAAREASVNPEVVFAEIAQLSDIHTDNINRRLAVYDFEIPINSISVLPLENQILPCDLLVSVQNGEVIVESRKLKKRVIPRLTSAYNFQHNNLAVFRFLCDLQYQGQKTALAFDLENFFPGMDFYPRVSYKSNILSVAKWRISNYSGEGVHSLRARLGLPAAVALTRFDQQLVFNLDIEAEARFFEEVVRGMNNFVVSEFLMPARVVTDSKGDPLINQFVAFLASRQPVYNQQTFVPAVTKTVERNFILGSSWLYLKIYCTPSSASRLLTKKILPVIRSIKKKEEACWFFIRYADPSYHIRLRIRVNQAHAAVVIKKLKSRFEGLVRNQVVRAYQADVYSRELERYGSRYIQAAELLFECSSELVVCYLRNDPEGNFPPERLAIPAFLSLLEQFFPEEADQVACLEHFSASFQAEFRADKTLKIELDRLYREMRADIEELAAGKEKDVIRRLKLGKQWAAFVSQGKVIAGLCLYEPLPKRMALLADLVHMHLNRQFPTKQREHEMVLYYCLLKYKLSRLARTQKSKGSPWALFAVK